VDLGNPKAFPVGEKRGLWLLSLGAQHSGKQDDILVELTVEKPGKVSLNIYKNGKRLGEVPILEDFGKIRRLKKPSE